MRVLPPAAPKIIPRLLSGRKCSGAGLSNRACSVGFASCLVSRLGCHIVWQLSAAAFKHPCLKLWASTITHPCTTRKLRVLAPAAPKIIPRLLSGRKCSEVCQNAVVGVGASLRRLCATAITHPCVCGRWGRRILARPAQCGFSPQHQKKQGYACLGITLLFLVPMAGVEPARYCYQRILSPSRLPIPSHRLIKMCRKTALYNGNNDFTV